MQLQYERKENEDLGFNEQLNFNNDLYSEHFSLISNVSDKVISESEKIAEDCRRQLEDLKKETFQKLEDLKHEAISEDVDYLADLIAFSLNSSVRPKAVIIPFKKKKAKLSKKALAVGTCAFLAVAGITGPHIVKMIKNVAIERELYKDIENFKRDNYNIQVNYDPKTEKVTHFHDATEIVSRALNIYKDPIIAVYCTYNSLDSDCRNNDFDRYIKEFNSILNTDYQNLDDFLIRNNMTNKEEWQTYVINGLMDEKENQIYGDSTSRR